MSSNGTCKFSHGSLVARLTTECCVWQTDTRGVTSYADVTKPGKRSTRSKNRARRATWDLEH